VVVRRAMGEKIQLHNCCLPAPAVILKTLAWSPLPSNCIIGAAIIVSSIVYSYRLIIIIAIAALSKDIKIGVNRGANPSIIILKAYSWIINSVISLLLNDKFQLTRGNMSHCLNYCF